MFLLWRDLVQERVGLYLKESQSNYLSKRLWQRMRQLSINDYGDYYNLINQGHNKDEEWEQLVELVVNCESSFFRDVPAFAALMGNVFPGLLTKMDKEGDRSFSMWSAGCARGQEAYSLAMAFAHVYGEKGPIGLRVLGTDISLKALSRATKGEYSLAETDNMDPLLREKYMIRIDTPSHSQSSTNPENHLLARHRVRYRVREEIRRSVHFGFMNLNRPTNHSISMQDVILCQNVLIYFSHQDRAKTIALLLGHLKPGGYLFLSPGENMGVKAYGADIVRFEDISAYRRNKENINVQIAQ
jgi:chemotaxis methyl-accepting protein methylase